MRTTFFISLVGLLLGVAVIALIEVDPGYVLIARERWSLEMAFSAFLVLLAVTFFAVYLGVRLLVYVLHTPRSVRHRRAPSSSGS